MGSFKCVYVNRFIEKVIKNMSLILNVYFVDICSVVTCSNGGVCKPYSQYMGYEQYTCECPDRFEGNQCEIDLDPCANNPCGGNGNQ